MLGGLWVGRRGAMQQALGVSGGQKPWGVREGGLSDLGCHDGVLSGSGAMGGRPSGGFGGSWVAMEGKALVGGSLGRGARALLGGALDVQGATFSRNHWLHNSSDFNSGEAHSLEDYDICAQESCALQEWDGASPVPAWPDKQAGVQPSRATISWSISRRKLR